MVVAPRLAVGDPMPVGSFVSDQVASVRQRVTRGRYH